MVTPRRTPFVALAATERPTIGAVGRCPAALRALIPGWPEVAVIHIAGKPL
jgi:hypothetical protein